MFFSFQSISKLNRGTLCSGLDCRRLKLKDSSHTTNRSNTAISEYIALFFLAHVRWGYFFFLSSSCRVLLLLLLPLFLRRSLWRHSSGRPLWGRPQAAGLSVELRRVLTPGVVAQLVCKPARRGRGSRFLEHLGQPLGHVLLLLLLAEDVATGSGPAVLDDPELVLPLDDVDPTELLAPLQRDAGQPTQLTGDLEVGAFRHEHLDHVSVGIEGAGPVQRGVAS